MKLGFKELVREAFSARPIGMFVPPNWIGLAAFGLLGFLNPGVWVLGAGCELAYLYTLVTNRRFQRFVGGQQALAEQRSWRGRIERILDRLGADDRAQYGKLEERCRSILEQQRDVDGSLNLTDQGVGLGKLLWIHLRLLLTRTTIQEVLREASVGEKGSKSDLEKRLGDLATRLKDEKLTDELRRSLQGQLEILEQRLAKQREARDKLAFVDAELTRLQEQVELIREQAMLSTNAGAVSERIDQVAETLGNTTQWIQEQQQIYGQVEDLLEGPQPALVPRQKVSQ